MLDKPNVVFFDAAGTLLFPFPSVGAVYARAAADFGVIADPGSLDARFKEAWIRRSERGQLASASTEAAERAWWRELVHEVFIAVQGFSDFEAFFDHLYNAFALPEAWRLFEDTRPALERLRSDGIRLAVLSNWDSRLYGILEGLNIRHYFETVIASTRVGAAKPAEKIFHHALTEMRLSGPSQSMHVGDSLQEDFYGAREAGLQAVLLNRQGRAYNEAPVITSLLELPSLWS